MAIPIDPTLSTLGKEWQIESPTATDGAQQGAGKFGGALTKAISALEDGQNQAASAAQSVVDGSARGSAISITAFRSRRRSRSRCIAGVAEMKPVSACREKSVPMPDGPVRITRP